jgi:catechol 2,3-dioxygenase-like lactoylglutathione lyase family enzyme
VTLQHVTLELRKEDVPAELAFWALLGFEEVEPPGSLGERSAWAERDGTQIHLQFADAPTVPRSAHVAVVADDWEAAFAALQEAGHEPEEHERYWGAPRAFARTPGGHLVEVMAAAPSNTSPPP